jgi:cyclohexa-1,5-dienecarbonyl-CoA hydratase
VSGEPLAIEDKGGARWITLQRPPLNVLDLPTIRALREAVRPRARRRDLKVLVLRSAIPGTFSAGVDVRDHGKDRVSDMLEAFHAVFRLLDGVPQATVAAVDGRCLGGGLELAAFCDVLLATPRSVFGQPEIDVGCFPPVGAVLLPRIVGRAAIEMVLTGAPVSAEEAARMGLVSRVVDDLQGETAACVDRLTARSAGPSSGRSGSTGRTCWPPRTWRRACGPSWRSARRAGRTVSRCARSSTTRAWSSPWTTAGRASPTGTCW